MLAGKIGKMNVATFRVAAVCDRRAYEIPGWLRAAAPHGSRRSRWGSDLVEWEFAVGVDSEPAETAKGAVE